MLTSLYIENIAIIRQMTLEFYSGFTILTGETGAGKSILIDSIGLLLGNKARKELIGSFAESSVVKANFSSLSAEVTELLKEEDIFCDDDEIFVERKISKDGRSTAKINSVQVSVAFLQKLAPLLINIHGQHDHILMLDNKCHIEFLDRFSEIDSLLGSYRTEYLKLRDFRANLQHLQKLSEERESRLNHLSFKLEEYQKLDPYVGMLSSLQARKKVLQNRQSIEEFVKVLHPSEELSVLSMISDALAKAEKLLETDDRFKEIYIQLEQMQELASSVLIQGDDIVSEFDFSETLTDIEDKIYLLQQMLVKYGPTEEDLLLDWERTQKEFEQTNSLDRQIAQCRQDYVAQRQKVYDIALKISQKRKSSAEILSSRVQDELSFLDMKGVRFVVNVEQNLNEKGGFVYNSRGFDKVEFLISTNVGQVAKPLHKIASGGELSRIMLSLTNVLSKQQVIGTLIFDEVDTGVSGKTAEKIGVKLKEASADRQVLCITHLAQIASMGDHHYKISKSLVDGITQTEVDALDDSQRIEEISRIIGGIEITDAIRATAKEMLKK